MTHLIIDGCSQCYSSCHASDMADAIWRFDQYMKTILIECQCDKYTGFTEAIGEKHCFRNHVAMTKPYKGSRVGKDKPPFTNQIKEYACDKWGFEWCHNFEADDACIIKAYDLGFSNVIIAHCDKDLKQVGPLRFYDYFKREFSTVTAEEGEYNYWHSVLVGDSVDSICGLPKVGEVVAKKILDGVQVADMPNIVASAYIERGHDYRFFLEQCRLLRLLHYRGEVYTPLTLDEWNNLAKAIDAR